MTQRETIQLELDPQNTKYIVSYLKKPDDRGRLVIVYNPDGSEAGLEPEGGPGPDKIKMKDICSEVLVEYQFNPYIVCNRNICWRTK